MRVPLVVLLACLPFAAAFAPAARAAEVEVGIEDLEYFPHYGLDAASGEITGLGPDLIRAFAAAEGHKVTFRLYPVVELIAGMVAGRIDFAYPDHPGWTRDVKGAARVAYSAPVFAFTDGILVRPERLGKGEGALKVIGTLTGFTPAGFERPVREGEIRLEERDDMPALIALALGGQADGIYASPEVADHYLRRQKATGALVFDPGLPRLDGAYHLSTVHQGGLLAAFDRWLAANRARVSALKAAYGVN